MYSLSYISQAWNSLHIHICICLALLVCLFHSAKNHFHCTRVYVDRCCGVDMCFSVLLWITTRESFKDTFIVRWTFFSGVVDSVLWRLTHSRDHADKFPVTDKLSVAFHKAATRWNNTWKHWKTMFTAFISISTSTVQKAMTKLSRHWSIFCAVFFSFSIFEI